MKRLAHSPELNGPVVVEVPDHEYAPAKEWNWLYILAGIILVLTLGIALTECSEPGPVNIPHKSTTGSEG